jgi:hypothetical protein
MCFMCNHSYSIPTSFLRHSYIIPTSFTHHSYILHTSFKHPSHIIPTSFPYLYPSTTATNDAGPCSGRKVDNALAKESATNSRMAEWVLLRLAGVAAAVMGSNNMRMPTTPWDGGMALANRHNPPRNQPRSRSDKAA